MKYGTLKEIRELAVWALRECGTPELVPLLTVEFNGRFTRRAGDAMWRIRAATGEPEFARIRFSTPLWPRMGEEDRRETIIHEACHLAAACLHPGKRVRHGLEWKVLMVRCGAKGDRCHEIDRTGLRRRMPRYEVKCGCKTHHVTARMLEKIRKSDWRTYYYCRSCKCKLRATEAPVLADAA